MIALLDRTPVFKRTSGHGAAFIWFPENDWVGRRISIGDELTLEVLIPCPRCVMTTLSQGDRPLDSGILRTAAQQNNVMIAPLGHAMPSVGVYAKVLTGGMVRRGDHVRLMN